MLATITMTLFMLSPRGSGNRELQPITQGIEENIVSRGRRDPHLSGGVGAGAGAVTPAAGRSGAGAAARRRSPPRGAGSIGAQTVFKENKFEVVNGKKNEREAPSTHLRLMRGGLRRHMGGGGGILRGGESLRGGGRTR